MSSGEKLSQDQIDALLKAMQEGEELPDFNAEAEQKENFQEYDFNRPEKFGIEHLRSLQTIATTFGKGTIQPLSARIRLPIELEPSTVEQVPFMSEYVEKMPKDYYLYCVVDLGLPHLGEIVVELDLAFVTYIHECWLGGDPKGDFKLRRSLTAFEFLTLENLFIVLCDMLKQSLESVVDVNPRLISTTTTPTTLKITTASDIIALLNVNMKTEHWDTTVRIGIPFLSIETIMDDLASENVVKYFGDQDKNYSEEVESELKKVPKQVHISVGEQKMKIAELAQIEEGDIIPLNKQITSTLKGYVGGMHKFNCFIGKEGNRKAFLFKEYVE
ncbi:flagellar motor switch protein FliM [Microbacteriaceae bacterium 4G12]